MTFYPESFRRFLLDITGRQQVDLTVIPAEHLTADPLGDAFDDVMDGMVAAGLLSPHPSQINQLCEEWAREVAMCADSELAEMTNPLADGHFCPECGTRLDKADRPCPFAPHEETR